HRAYRSVLELVASARGQRAALARSAPPLRMVGTRLGNQIRAASPSDNVADVCVHLLGLVRCGGVIPSTRVARALETGSASYCATSALVDGYVNDRRSITFHRVSLSLGGATR